MPHDQFRAAIDGVRAKLVAEVEAQLGLLSARHDEALERVILESAVSQQPASTEALPALSSLSHLLGAFQEIDRPVRVSDILTTLVRQATVVAPRVALFVLNRTTLQEWLVRGIPPLATGPLSLQDSEAGILADALLGNRSVPGGGPNEAAAPPFALLPAGRTALAVPIAPGNEPVAVLYADEDVGGVAADGWRDIVELLARHAASRLAYVTTIRTAEAVRLIGDRAEEPWSSSGAAFDEQAARRYARLVVSEIKLYNEAAVRAGRERRDLRFRLAPEIERARRLYEAHVPEAVPVREACFQQELVQTLAGGDPALLG